MYIGGEIILNIIFLVSKTDKVSLHRGHVEKLKLNYIKNKRIIPYYALFVCDKVIIYFSIVVPLLPV